MWAHKKEVEETSKSPVTVSTKKKHFGDRDSASTRHGPVPLLFLSVELAVRVVATNQKIVSFFSPFGYKSTGRTPPRWQEHVPSGLWRGRTDQSRLLLNCSTEQSHDMYGCGAPVRLPLRTPEAAVRSVRHSPSAKTSQATAL